MHLRTLLIFVLSVAFVFSLVFARQNQLTAPAEDFVLKVLAPFEQVMNGIVRPVADSIESLQTLGQLKTENERLESQLETLTTEVIRLREVEIENKRLKQELGLKLDEGPSRFLPANIISRDPTNLVRTIRINKGREHGVKQGMVVVSTGGLTGKVIEVLETTSKVLLITDPSSSVNGMIQRADSRATGIVVGQPGDQLLMKFLPQNEQIKNDDIVITSGLGGNYPKGLLIGKVTQVNQSDVELFQEARMEPAVRFGKLEDVLVVLDFLPPTPEG